MDEECKWGGSEGVRVGEGKGEKRRIREPSLCLLASGGSVRH